MMEYMMLRASVRHFDLSRLFLYKTTRKLLGWTGDTGAYLRSTLQAAATFGVPPERYWDYDIELFEEEPEAFHYSFAAGSRRSTTCASTAPAPVATPARC
jgi:C1A family cysteine protease